MSYLRAVIIYFLSQKQILEPIILQSIKYFSLKVNNITSEKELKIFLLWFYSGIFSV
jgi:hypothetical protein